MILLFRLTLNAQFDKSSLRDLSMYVEVDGYESEHPVHPLSDFDLIKRVVSIVKPNETVTKIEWLGFVERL